MADSPKRSRWPWVVAGLLVAATLIAAVVGVAEVCEEAAFVVESSVKVVEICRPAPLTDPRYIFVLIIAGVIVWQDLSELTVGSFSMKRRLEKTESEQTALKQEVASLTQTIQQNQTTVVRIEPLYVNTEELRAQLQASGLAVHEEESGETTETPSDAVVEIIRANERLHIFDTSSGQVPESLEFLRPDGPTQSARRWAAEVADLWPEAEGLGATMAAEQAHVFTSNFPDMLNAVRAVRNAAAHGREVADDDLAATVETAHALEYFLLDRFDHWRSLDQEGLDIGPRIGVSDGSPRFSGT